MAMLGDRSADGSSRLSPMYCIVPPHMLKEIASLAVDASYRRIACPVIAPKVHLTRTLSPSGGEGTQVERGGLSCPWARRRRMGHCS